MIKPPILILTLGLLLQGLCAAADRHCPGGPDWSPIPRGASLESNAENQPSWVGNGSRLAWQPQRGLVVQAAAWRLGDASGNWRYTPSHLLSPRLMLRGARQLSPLEAETLHVRQRWESGWRADFLQIEQGQDWRFQVPAGHQPWIELIQPDEDARSSLIVAGYAGQASQTHAVLWPLTIDSEPALRRIGLGLASESTELHLQPAAPMRVRVLALPWRRDLGDPAIPFTGASTDRSVLHERDNRLLPGLRAALGPSGSRTHRYFRPLQPSSAAVLAWRPAQQSHGLGSTSLPWAALGEQPVAFALPPREADTELQLYLRGGSGQARLQLADSTLPLMLYPSGPDDPCGTEPADGQLRLTLPSSIQSVMVSGDAGLAASLALLTARPFRLEPAAYRTLAAGQPARTLLREALAQPVNRILAEAKPGDGPAAELHNHWLPMLRRLADAVDAATPLPGCSGTVEDPLPTVIASPLDRRRAAQRARCAADPADREAAWQLWQAAKMGDHPRQRIRLAWQRLREADDAQAWRWLAEAMAEAGWHDWANDIRLVADLPAADPSPAKDDLPAVEAGQTDAVGPAGWAGGLGAVAVRARGAESQQWLQRASQGDPISLPVPAGARSLLLQLRPTALGGEVWIELADHFGALVAVPLRAWQPSPDLLTVVGRQPVGSATVVRLPLDASSGSLEVRPRRGEIWLQATWSTAEVDGEGPLVALRPSAMRSDWAFAQRYRLDHGQSSLDAEAELWRAADSGVPGAAEALRWNSKRRWQRLPWIDGGAGYRDRWIDGRETLSPYWREHNARLSGAESGMLLRSGQTHRQRLGAAGRYRLQARRHELFGDAEVIAETSLGLLGTDGPAQEAELPADSELRISLPKARPVRQVELKLQRFDGQGWKDVALGGVQRWWLATAAAPLRVIWPQPTLARVDSLRGGRIKRDWVAIGPDRPLTIRPQAGESERAVRVSLAIDPPAGSEQPATTATTPVAEADSWLRTPPAGPEREPVSGLRRHSTDLLRLSSEIDMIEEDDGATATALDSRQIGIARLRRLDHRPLHLAAQLAVRRSAGVNAAGISGSADWLPTGSVWSGQFDLALWRTKGETLTSARGALQADWQFGSRWETQSRSQVFWRDGPTDGIADAGLWNRYRAEHRHGVAFEQQANWWLSPSRHALARLAWRSNENLSGDHYTGWLGGRAAHGRWSLSAEIGRREYRQDADRDAAFGTTLLRVGVDGWIASGDGQGWLVALSAQHDRRRRDTGVLLQLNWFAHGGRELLDFSPRRYRLLEVRRAAFNPEAEWQ